MFWRLLGFSVSGLGFKVMENQEEHEIEPGQGEQKCRH